LFHFILLRACIEFGIIIIIIIITIISGSVASAGYGLLVLRGFVITHDAPQSVGLLWMSYQLIAATFI
jgi:hypothetical protein